MKKYEWIKRIKCSFACFCIAVFCTLLAFGCSTQESSDKTAAKEPGGKSPALAKIGDTVISAADFKGYLSERSPSYRSPVSEESIKQRLDERILDEVLYKEALRLKLDQDPKVQNNIRMILNQKLIREQVIQEVGNRKIEDTELQEYYDRNQYEFNRPEQVRLADIFITVPPDAPAKEKAELKKKAETALAEALKTAGNKTAFIRLAGNYSDTNPKYTKGDTGFFDKDGNPVGINKNLAEEAFKLENNGSITDHVIETPDGYHVIMRTGKRYATHRPFDRVRNQIQQRIRREEIQQKRQEYTEQLKQKADIQVDDTVMAQILKELHDAQKKHPMPVKRNMPPERPLLRTPPQVPPKAQGVK